MTADKNTFRIYRFLSPFAFLYGIGVRLRNRLFDWGLLRSESFDVPVICVGNLAVGGTGKTPHTEYIIRLLRGDYRIAVLSRGYKRKTKGFVLARPGCSSLEIGDEPFQIWRKFPGITVAVDADRRRGIRNLLALPPEARPEVILLDDAFQHRYVRPSLRIVLTDYHRLYFRDCLLPAGRLREPASGIRRADAVIVTKCEANIPDTEYHRINEAAGLRADQPLYFSHIVYGGLEAVFPEIAPERSLHDLSGEEVLLVSGIAHPEYFEHEIRQYTGKVTSLTFPDHHAFGTEDIRKVEEAFEGLTSPRKLIIVTEKDAARLRDIPLLPAGWRDHLYLLPITIGFPPGQAQRFDAYIRQHIITLNRNRI